MLRDPWKGGRLLARAVAFVGVYMVLLTLAYPAGLQIAPGMPLWWPAGGFSLGVLLRSPRRAWPALLALLFVVLLVLGLVGVPSNRHLPPVVSLCYAAAAVTVPLLGATLVNRLGSRPFDLSRVHDVLVFAVCGAFLPSVLRIAWTYVAWLIWPEPRPAITVLAAWTPESSGIITVAPVILAGWGRGLQPEGRPEAGMLFALLVGATLGAFLLPTLGLRILSLAVAAFPLLTWAAARFGPRGAAGAAFALTALSTFLTLQWPGPFGTEFRAADAQVFLSMAALSALVLAAFGEERRRLFEKARTDASHLEEAYAILDGLLRSAPVGIAVFDRNLRFVRINEALARINGQPPEAHLGRRIQDVLPGIGEEIAAELRRARDRGEDVVGREVAGEFPGEPGRVRSFLCNWYPIRVPGGVTVGVGAIVLEITERVEADAARVKTLADLEEALRVREDFLSIASHELKTPLTPLALRLQLLQRSADAGEAIDPRAVEKARSALARLTALTSDLLDVARVRDARLTVRKEIVPLSKLVGEVAGRYRDRSPHRLALDLEDEDVWVLGERARLAQVVDNLVDNAFKFSPGGGHIQVSLTAADGDAHIAIADEGIGVPPDERDRVFDRFHRASNASARSYGGLGLGLYLCRAIIESHGGRIWLESELGRGSTFHVVLPRLGNGGDRVATVESEDAAAPPIAPSAPTR